MRRKGQRRVGTANGLIMAPEYLFRLGFVCGDYSDPDFVADQQYPHVLEPEFIGFGLQTGFEYPVLIGMDVIGLGDLRIDRDGFASLELP